MSWLAESLVIFLTFTVFICGVAWGQGRPPRIPLARLADPAPLPGECDHEYTPNEAGTYEWCQKCDSVRPVELPRAGRLPSQKPADWPVDPVWNEQAGRWLCGYGCSAQHGTNPACPMHVPPTLPPFDLPGTLARFPAPGGSYGPFPVDTGPLLILSDKTAANVALEREIRQRCAEAEAKIPPRWR